MSWAAGLGQAAAGAASGSILAMVTSKVRDAIATIMSVAFMWSFHGIVRLAPDQALALAKTITKTYYAPPVEWAGFLQEYMQQMTGATIKLEDIVGRGAGLGQREVMERLGERFLTPMLSLIMPTKEEVERNPMGGAERFMSTNLQFQMSAWLLHLLGDIQSFGTFKSLKDLPNAISWSYGIGWLSWMVMGPVFRASITEGMEKHFNTIYRSVRMGTGQIIDAYYAGVKTATRTHRELAEKGYEDEDIEFMIKQGRKRFSESQMEYLVRYGWKTKAEIISYYADQGIEQADAEAMASKLLTKEGDSYINKIVSEAENQYKAGVMSLETLRNYYTESGLTSEEITLALAALDMQSVGRRTLTEAQIGRLYQLGKFTKDEALSRLEKEYTTTEEAELFLELYPPKEIPEAKITTRELSISEIGRLYKAKQLTEEAAIAMLVERKMIPSDAALYLLLHERDEEKEIPPLEAGITAPQIGRLYSKGYLTEAQATDRLVLLGYPKSEAALFLALYVPAVPPVPAPPVALTAAQVGRLYQLKTLTREVAEARLMDIYKDATEVSLFLALYPQPEEAPAAEAKLRLLTSSQIINLFNHMVFSYDNSYGYLIALGYLPEDAIALLEPSFETLTPEDLGARYQLDLLTWSQTLERLQNLGYTTDEATAFLAPYESLRGETF